MIAIDTNVLLRYLLWDDEEQAKKADALIKGTSAVLVTDIVLVEMVWILRGKRYKLNKTVIIKTINSLFEEINIYFENPQIIWQALSDYQKAPIIKLASKNKTADFSDSLILNKAKNFAQMRFGKFGGFYTFDVAVQEMPGSCKP